jgi:integrator complex subunit 4
VRCLAARMIGRMTGVSAVFLAQTLDKKLMSNMRVKRSAHERMNELISSGEWSSGQKWADDAPKGHLQAEQVDK